MLLVVWQVETLDLKQTLILWLTWFLLRSVCSRLVSKVFLTDESKLY